MGNQDTVCLRPDTIGAKHQHETIRQRFERVAIHFDQGAEFRQVPDGTGERLRLSIGSGKTRTVDASTLRPS